MDTIKNIHPSWNNLFTQNNILLNKIFTELNKYDNSKIYPPNDLIFRIFSIDIKNIKIVLLGQDPYHGINQANGLAFSTDKNLKIQPSLINIFKELNIEFPERNYKFDNGDLTKWLNDEKIFLLNCALTVYDKTPGKFMNLWEPFTNNVIEYISDNNSNCIFLLFGNFAKSKIKYIDDDRCIECVHPSPLSASKGFFNSDIFKRVEQKLNIMINLQN
jgi:uracil-DNA glycosylase